MAMVGALIGAVICAVIGVMLFSVLTHNAILSILGFPIGAISGIFIGIWVSLKIAAS